MSAEPASKRSMSEPAAAAAAAPAVSEQRRSDLFIIAMCLAPHIYYDDESIVNEGRGADEPEKFGSGFRLHQLFKMSKKERMQLDRMIPRGQWGKVSYEPPSLGFPGLFHQTSGASYRCEIVWIPYWIRADCCTPRPAASM